MDQDSKRATADQSSGPNVRKPYTAPVLKKHGSVVELTKGTGTPTVTDAASSSV